MLLFWSSAWCKTFELETFLQSKDGEKMKSTDFSI